MDMNLEFRTSRLCSEARHCPGTCLKRIK